MVDAPQGTIKKSVVIIANPTASRFNPECLTKVAEHLQQHNCKVKLKLSQRTGETAALCRTTNADVVVIAGGDVSFNEAASALLERRTNPKLALIPFGTGNTLGNELCLPHDPKTIADLIVAGNSQPLYHGIANGRAFFAVASCGFDAEIVHLLPYRLKRRLKKIAYLAYAIKLGLFRRSTEISVETGGETYRAASALITNCSHYGGGFTLVRETSATKKGLVMVLLHSNSLWGLTCSAAKLITGKVAKSPLFTILPVEHVVINSKRPTAVQIDGEPYGGTPLHVETGHATLQIICP